MTSAPAIGFEYRPPSGLRRACTGVAILALVAIGLSAMLWWGQVLLAGAVLVTTWRTRTRLLGAPPLMVAWAADGRWSLCNRSSDEIAATLLSFRVLGGWVLLRLAAPGLGVQSLTLATDNSDGGLRRRLRMRLATVQAGEALPRI